MKYYNLDEDEVPLYKGKVILKNANGETNLILTNKKFVFINITKNEQGIEVISNVEYPVHEVKEYKGKYQVLKKGNVVETLLWRGSEFTRFNEKGEIVEHNSDLNN